MQTPLFCVIQLTYLGISLTLRTPLFCDMKHTHLRHEVLAPAALHFSLPSCWHICVSSNRGVRIMFDNMLCCNNMLPKTLSHADQQCNAGLQWHAMLGISRHH